MSAPLVSVGAVDALRKRLIEAGYAPVPVRTGKKVPVGDGWQVKARRHEVAPAMSWASNTGVLCDGLRAIDIDIDDPDLAARCLDVTVGMLGKAPLRFRNDSPRRLLVYRAADGEPGKRTMKGPPGRNVEILGRGQQFVGYGRHPDGAEYQWDGDDLYLLPVDDLIRIDEQQIDELFTRLAPILGIVAEEQQSAPTASLATFHPADDRAGLDELAELLTFVAADCGYEDWWPILAAIHDATNGSIAGLDLADQWSASGGARYAGRKAIERKWQSFRTGGGFGTGTIAEGAQRNGADLSEIARRYRGHQHEVVDQAEATEASARLAAGMAVRERIDPETGEITDIGITISEAGTVDTLYDGADWLRPAGLMGEMVEWILHTSRRPNRPLAVAAAIATVAAACSRHISTPTRRSTHLFVAMIGDSFVGKDRPLKAASTMLDAAGIPISTTGKFKSDSGIEAMLKEMPARLATVDEMGQNIFARIGRRNGSAHEDGISGMLRELWGVAFEPWNSSQSASNTSVRIFAPTLTLFGASTPEEFYRSLAAGSVENGFLNRFLVIKAAPRSAVNDAHDDPREVPKNIVDGLRKLLPSGLGNLRDDSSPFVVNSEPKYTLMPWAADAVAKRFTAFEERLIVLAEEDREFGGVVGRTAEMALRLATVHAVSRDGRYAALEDGDLSWGIAVATCSASAMAADARDRIAENDSQRNYNRVRQIIREAGPAGLTRGELTKKLKGAIVGKPYDDAVNALVEAGEVVAVALQPAKQGGRPGVRYHIAGGGRFLPQREVSSPSIQAVA